MPTKTKMTKMTKKVYTVHTGLNSIEDDSTNYRSFNTIAVHVLAAISNVQHKFIDGEYVESVEMILVLDD